MAIDVHAHYVPPAAIEKLQAAGAAYGIDVVESEPGCRCLRFGYGVQVRPFFDRLFDLDERVRVMEGQGVRRQVLSLWTDIFGYGLPAAEGARWHRLLNTSLHDATQGAPERFSLLVSGPLQDPAAAARELEFGLRELGAVGAVVAANIEGVNLGEAALDEFWSAAVELGAPVFIHPAQPVPEARTRRYNLTQIAQYTMDTTLAVGSLIASGVLDRYPKLELLLSHGGGGIPFLIGRFDLVFARADRAQSGIVAEHKPSAYLRRFHYDTIVHSAEALRYLVELVQADRVMIGTDYPFPPRDDTPLEQLRAAGLTDDQTKLIATANAERLFGL